MISFAFYFFVALSIIHDILFNYNWFYFILFYSILYFTLLRNMFSLSFIIFYFILIYYILLVGLLQRSTSTIATINTTHFPCIQSITFFTFTLKPIFNTYCMTTMFTMLTEEKPLAKCKYVMRWLISVHMTIFLYITLCLCFTT